MKNDYTHLVVLLDRSGSMNGCWNDTIGGLNTFLAEQKLLPGKMTISVYTFNNTITTPILFSDITTVQVPMYFGTAIGGTALNDAFCKAVDETGVKLAAMPASERPTKILFTTVTDGDENGSKIFNLEDVKARLKTQQDIYSWNFMFMGADFDNQKQAVSMGASAASTLKFTKACTADMYKHFSDSYASYRDGDARAFNVQELACKQKSTEDAR